MRELKIIGLVLLLIIGVTVLTSKLWYYSGGKAAELQRIQHQPIIEQQRRQEEERARKRQEALKKKMQELQEMVETRIERKSKFFFRTVELIDEQQKQAKEIIRAMIEKQVALNDRISEVRKNYSQELNGLLDEEQKQELQALRGEKRTETQKEEGAQKAEDTQKPESQPQPETVDDLMERFYKGIALTPKQEKKARTLFEQRTTEIDAIKSELESVKAQAESDLLNLLTPEQREQYEAAKEKFTKGQKGLKGKKKPQPQKTDNLKVDSENEQPDSTPKSLKGRKSAGKRKTGNRAGKQKASESDQSIQENQGSL